MSRSAGGWMSREHERTLELVVEGWRVDIGQAIAPRTARCDIADAAHAALTDLRRLQRIVTTLESEHFLLDTRAALTGLLAAGYDQATPEGARETARAALLMAEALREERSARIRELIEAEERAKGAKSRG